MRTTLRCWPTEAFGSAIGRGATGRTEAPASAGAAGAFSSDFFSAFSPPPLQPQPVEPPQLEQPEPPPLRPGGEELVDAELGPVGVARGVDQQIAEKPVHQPGRDFHAFWDLFRAFAAFPAVLLFLPPFEAWEVAARADATPMTKTAAMAAPRRQMRFTLSPDSL